MSFNTSPCLVALALLAAQPAPAAETLQQWAEEVRVTEKPLPTPWRAAALPAFNLSGPRKRFAPVARPPCAVKQPS